MRRIYDADLIGCGVRRFRDIQMNLSDRLVISVHRDANKLSLVILNGTLTTPENHHRFYVSPAMQEN
jgi:hypothetical protein